MFAQPYMLEADINALTAAGASADREAVRAPFAALRDALSAGTVRVAEPDSSRPVGWRVDTTPVIVKYRDSRTETRTELEAWIR